MGRLRGTTIKGELLMSKKGITEGMKIVLHPFEEEMKKMTPFEAFVSFYEDMNKVPLSDEEEKLMSKVFDELMEETQ